MPTAAAKTGVPAGSARPAEYYLPILDGDVAMLATALSRPAEPPEATDDAYLDLPIEKLWGYEVRVYDDRVSEAWFLSIDRSQRTSTHAHPIKETVLVCLDGEGVLRDGDHRPMPLRPGTVARIDRGAVHCSEAATPLRLLEFEIPRAKRDLVRFDRPGGYEGPRAARPSIGPGRPLVPLLAVPGGPPQARVRGRCGDDSFRVAVERGADIRARPTGLCAAITVELGPMLQRNLTVLTARTAVDAAHDHRFLTVRREAA